MWADRIREIARKLFREHEAIMAAFPDKKALADLPLSDAPMRMESFRSEWGQEYENWKDVRSLYVATRMAKTGNENAFEELSEKRRLIKEFVTAV